MTTRSWPQQACLKHQPDAASKLCTGAAQSQPPIERDETMFCCGSTDEQAPSSAPPQSPAAGKSDATLVTIQYCGS